MNALQLLALVATFGRFVLATALDYDVAGNVYVVDRQRDMLVKYSPRGDSLRSVAGRGVGTLQFDTPVSVFARRGNDIYVADYNNHRVERFDRALDYIATIYTREDPDQRKRFGYPLDMAVDRQGDLFILDGENRRVLKIDPFGAAEVSFGDIGGGAGRLVDPSAIEVDDEDNIYVLDKGRAMVFDPFGSYVRDFPNPLGDRVTAMSIDRDTLLLSDSTTVLMFDLKTVSSVGQFKLDAPAAAMRLRDGYLWVAEPKRIAVYAIRQ
jgi:DNA-binding beta-propeller fold protein YncE